MTGNGKRNKKATRQKIPQVALLLESSHEISRGMLRGILNYVRLYGPWALRINAGLNIRVTDVADHLGVTRRWAEKRFEHALNRSVLDEIQRVRMDTLRALVSETDQPFTRIAQRCGFTSANHLGIIFKKRFGVTMGDYRKQSAR